MFDIPHFVIRNRMEIIRKPFQPGKNSEMCSTFRVLNEVQFWIIVFRINTENRGK